MTSETGGHVDLESLAELDEGLLPAEQTASTNAHLEACAECRRRHAALRTTRALLTTLPPDPMPGDVVARLDTALADAALSSPTVVPLERKRRRWMHHPTLPGLAAAFAALALISAVAVGFVSSQHNDKQGSSASAPGGTTSTTTTGARYPVSTSGHDYTRANVPQLVPSLLGASGVASPSPNNAAGPNTGAQPRQQIDPQLARLYSSRSALRACIAALTGVGQAVTPLAVDFARYNGHAAVVVVLPGLAANSIDAWIVGPNCGAPSEDLLLYESVPRPSG